MRRSHWLLLLSTVACRHADRALPVPATTGPVTIEGEWDEPDWSNVALREQFVDDSGGLARPSSEIRLLHDAATLYVGLYAADDNIQSTDAFEVSLDSLELRVDATGKVTPTVPGLRVGIDRDGTLDDPSNFDGTRARDSTVRDDAGTGPRDPCACQTLRHTEAGRRALRRVDRIDPT